MSMRNFNLVSMQRQYGRYMQNSGTSIVYYTYYIPLYNFRKRPLVFSLIPLFHLSVLTTYIHNAVIFILICKYEYASHFCQVYYYSDKQINRKCLDKDVNSVLNLSTFAKKLLQCLLNITYIFLDKDFPTLALCYCLK